MDNLWLKVENIVAKGEIARFVQFLLLSLCFQKAICCRGSESVYMRERVKLADGNLRQIKVQYKLNQFDSQCMKYKPSSLNDDWWTSKKCFQGLLDNLCCRLNVVQRDHCRSSLLLLTSGFKHLFVNYVANYNNTAQDCSSGGHISSVNVP